LALKRVGHSGLGILYLPRLRRGDVLHLSPSTKISTSRGAIAVRADSADPVAIRNAVAETVERLGTLDVAVVNAGVLRRALVEVFTLEAISFLSISRTSRRRFSGSVSIDCQSISASTSSLQYPP
jgi:NAD(P)-dependent dehydrogenase (short-subunit alcohol dehydrogenase family)